MDLIHCIYCSAATNPSLGPEELEAILEQSRTNNAKRDVTGILLFHQGSFFQVLEGERDVVSKVFRRITGDPRHTKVMKVVEESIDERAFGEWTMGYPRMTTAELAGIPGMSDFFSGGSSFLSLEEGRAKSLLAAFKEGKWRKTVA